MKRYFSIGEVAEMLDVSKSLIRYWEAEFDVLKPHKNSKGERRFTIQNIEQLKIIYHLIKERGFTINGAKREIQLQRKLNKDKQDIIKSLEKMKAFLIELRGTL